MKYAVKQKVVVVSGEYGDDTPGIGCVGVIKMVGENDHDFPYLVEFDDEVDEWYAEDELELVANDETPS